MSSYSKLTLQQKIAKQTYHKKWRDLRYGKKISIFDMETPPPIRAYNRKNKFVSTPQSITEENEDSNSEDDNISVMTDNTEATSNEFISTPFIKREDLLDLECECLCKMKNKGIDTQEKAERFISNVNQADFKNSLKPFDLRTPANVKSFLTNVITFL